MKKKRRSGNPWAICTAAGLKRGSAKFERCVMAVKSRKNPPAAGWRITHDGETLAHFPDVMKGEIQAFAWLHKRVSSSAHHALEHEGYDIVLVLDGKVINSYKRDVIGRSKKNPSVSAEWPKMKDRQRFAALQFAGVPEDRAKYHAILGWSDLPAESKSALLRGWHMASIGGTTRRYRDTTRRIPVLTNSSGPRRFGDAFHAGKVIARNAEAFRRHRSMKVQSLAEEYFASYVRLGVVKSRDRAAWVRAFKAGIRSSLKDAGVLPNPTAGWAVTHDGETLKQFGPGIKGANAARVWLLQRQSQSIDWATKHEGYDIVCVKGKKMTYSWRDAMKSRPNKRRSRRNSTKGAYPFKDKTEQYRQYEIGPLLHAQRDAMRAARAMKGHDPAAENWYMDDFFTISDEITRRRHGLKNRARRNGLTSYEIKEIKNDIKGYVYSAQSPSMGGPARTAFSARASEADRIMKKYADDPREFGPKAVVDWNPSSAPMIWRKRRHGKRTTHFRGPDPKFKVYFVAQFKPAYPRKGKLWAASKVIDALPPTVVGKIYKIAARSAVAAIKEARGL